MRFILIILILVMAVGAAFFVLQSNTQQQPTVNTVVEDKPEVQAVSILVARERIAVGTVITEDMIDQQPWPEHLLLSGFIRSSSPDANIVGMVTRSDFQPQEPISRFKIANPNDANFIAAALPKGMRAITVEIDTVSGVAGYIFPGDRIDIVMTHKIPTDLANPDNASQLRNDRSISATHAETVLSDIKILAVEIRGLTEYKTSAEQKRHPQAPTNITIQVTPEQAQVIRLAEKSGSLSMTLRALDEKGKQTFAATALKDLTGVDIQSGPKAKQRNAEVYIVRGVKSDKPKGATGGIQGAQPFSGQR